jgi:integrase
MAPYYKAGRKSPWVAQWYEGGAVKTAAFPTKRLAEEKERQMRIEKSAAAHGLENPHDETLFLDYAKTWVHRRFGAGIVDARKEAARLKNYWLPKLGTRPLRSIRTADVKAVLDFIQFTEGHRPADRNRHRALMHKLFRDALSDGKVQSNPVTPLELVEEKNKKWKAAPIKDDSAIDRYVAAMYARNPQFGMLCDLMLWTGARKGSCAALQWGDVESDRIRIRRLIDSGTGQVVSRQKGQGEGGEIIAPLIPQLAAKLDAHREVSQFTGDTDFIVHNGLGRQISISAFNTAHRELMADPALELPKFTPHSFRATFARRAQNAGISKADIKEMGGWETMAMLDRYLGKDAEHVMAAVKKAKFGALPKGAKVYRLKAGRS